MKFKKIIKLLSDCEFTNNGDTIKKCLEANKRFFQRDTFMLNSDILGCELLLNNKLRDSNSDVFYYGTSDELTQLQKDLIAENIITNQIENGVMPRIEFSSGGIKEFFSGEKNYKLIILFTQSQLEVFLKHVLLKTKVATIQKFVDGQNLSTNNVYFSNGNKNAVIDLAEFDGFPLQISLSKNNKTVKQILYNYEIQPLGNIPKNIEGFFDYIKTTVNPFGVR